MKTEIWKEFEENYAISNLGNIKNIKTNRMLKLRPSHNGYLKTNISIKGKLKTVFPHRLVGQMFISNPDNLPILNHKDENKHNNCVYNLEWCDNKYNVNYGTSQERKAQKQRKMVYKYDLEGNFIEKYISTREAAKSVNGNTGGISRVCNNQRKTYKGYIWKYNRDKAKVADKSPKFVTSGSVTYCPCQC